MKGVIPSGGVESRLQPITYTEPKQLIPIANKPVLEYAIESLKSAGVTEIAIVISDSDQEKFQNYFGDGNEFGVDITYVVQGDPLGLAHAVSMTASFVGSEPFVVYLGDILMEQGLRDLVKEFNSISCAATLGVKQVEEPSRYGIALIEDDNHLTEVMEKPDNSPSNCAMTGIYVFGPEIFDQIERVERSWRGEYELTSAIQYLLDDGYRVLAHEVDGWWKDVGMPRDVLEANQLVLDNLDEDVRGSVRRNAAINGRIVLGEESKITNGGVVHGPVSIGKNVTIGADAYIGPYTSVGDDCEITQACIESSVIHNDVCISCDNRIVNSLIGRGVETRCTSSESSDGERFVIDQDVYIEL